MIWRDDKRIADRVNDRIVASVLGLGGLPLPKQTAVSRAAIDAFREAPRAQANFNCLVREIVNGAVRASQFTHLPTVDAARATMLGVLQGAKSSGRDLLPIVSLACERLLWSTAALDEDLASCARGIIEGVQQQSVVLNGERTRMLELVIASALRVVSEIDDAQVEPARRAMAAAVCHV